MQNKPDSKADTILVDARIATLDERESFQSALAMKNGRFAAVGDERDVMGYRNAETRVIGVSGRTVIPGLVDSHTHFIREGLNYNLELRWDGVRSLRRTHDASRASETSRKIRRLLAPELIYLLILHCWKHWKGMAWRLETFRMLHGYQWSTEGV